MQGEALRNTLTDCLSKSWPLSPQISNLFAFSMPRSSASSFSEDAGVGCHFFLPACCRIYHAPQSFPGSPAAFSLTCWNSNVEQSYCHSSPFPASWFSQPGFILTFDSSFSDHPSAFFNHQLLGSFIKFLRTSLYGPTPYIPVLLNLLP